MAEVNTGNHDDGKKGKPKKMHLRVDFTPMVDMNMLLITFFMFATSLAKPQTMEIAMPSKDVDKVEEKSKVKDDKAITVLLGGENKLYYYLGIPDIADPNTLVRATYGGVDDPNSLRSLLYKRNKIAIEKIKRLKDQKDRKQIAEDFYKEEVKKIKNAKDGQVVIIKPSDESSYENLIDVLDEMAISSIGIYAVDDIKEGDLFLIKNLETGGEHAKQFEN
ncbi:MAG: biopolymer transporter ExbD [Bacteroidales bacterium]|nr:biopolymer transporter ExbD [Bacteroidales bacterium]